MISNEWLYGLIGLVIPVIANRLGLPILGPKNSAPNKIGEIIQQALIEILKGLVNSKLANAPADKGTVASK